MNRNSLFDIATFSPESIEFPNSWLGHLPFAAWVMRDAKPKIFVELGTHSGNSYFSFCQSVAENELNTKCYAIDTWQGDDHAGKYTDEIYSKVNLHNQNHFSGFSRLLRMTFDEAVSSFSDGSIDMLHIDGLHTYDAVKHDFETWLPKLAPGAIVMFHDTNVRERNFGVWKLWAELTNEYPNHLEFVHSHGLGVIQLNNANEEQQLDWLNFGKSEKKRLTNYFCSLGSSILRRCEIIELNKRVSNQDLLLSNNDQHIRALNEELTQRVAQFEELTNQIARSEQEIRTLNSRMEIEKKNDSARYLQLDENFKTEYLRKLKYVDEVEELRRQISAIENSKSWKITAPIRAMLTGTRNFKQTFFKKILRRYRLLPIRQNTKQKIKHIVFVILGPFLKNWPIYIQWKNYRDIDITWKDVSREYAVDTSKKMEFVSLVPMADGTFEWADYLTVKNKIQHIKAAQIANTAAVPMDIIRLEKESLAEVAARILLPECAATPDVSIILPVFNNIKLTLECLMSIAKFHSPGVTYEIIVADDASTDETCQILGSIPNVKLLHSDINLGFLLNCNRALDHVTGRYVLFLNNDVQVTEGWLSALLETFDTHPKVGAVGPRFVYPTGHLQEAGVALSPDGSAEMIGLNQNADQEQFSYIRRVDYVSGACLLIPTELVKQIGGFSEEFLPCYCEDSDLCLSIQDAGYFVYYNPNATIVHHLSKTTGATDVDFKMRCIYRNQHILQNKWGSRIEKEFDPKLIAFYLPQYHPIPENDKWWGTGFTEWTNVSKAKPNFVGHYQPRLPADLGYYDLRLTEVLEKQAQLAQRYGVHGFCFYYYWFNGSRLLEKPIEQMLESKKPDFPFCLCWANENWTRRWDGHDQEVLMAQSHSELDDEAVIMDLIRYFIDSRYIRIDGRPLILVYRVTLFPDFLKTSERWRRICREEGIGEIYIAMVESFDLVHTKTHPKIYGCDAAVEFPPHGLAQQKAPSGEVINPDFAGAVADYRDLVVTYALRNSPAYTRFRGVTPGWDNTARRVSTGFTFEHSSPGAFQAWLEETVTQTRLQQYGDERLIFVNAWNEWAEGAYLEPDRRFGHTYLEAVKNALDASRFLNKN